MQHPPLSAQFGQQLGVVSTLYRSLIESLLVPHDVTWAQFSLLLHLARRSGPSRISEIASAVNLTQPAVTKVVQKFSAQQMVFVRSDQNDGRNRLVEITEVGRTRLVAMQQSFGPAFHELLLDWSSEEIERLIHDLTRLSATLVTLNEAQRGQKKP
ncbi:MarR family winged helix-turn-helix transcriptional regulator [Donghicola mangrovi]|uniref:Winged helix-turn-helix transcriptional regulator n=1 Tax=Donghicola mangrovi TaxID=2729614 RepID=A0A850QEW7_9RHOB|nr:MarR family winged helix-turn-helix transcriptional regulator [Donghicola mangrovi]NVO25500.1 winged helix-turn-helix transcriptional regulator [Donghicola mangrovi]